MKVSGDLFVLAIGIQKMPWWYVDNLAIQLLVRTCNNKN